ncbi:MAG: hypothetical protein HY225_01505 [Candidatus Vogelbacteria bacterium]|nr:hypothetical protein [Candidatus Vogelbacteria bacterium]
MLQRIKNGLKSLGKVFDGNLNILSLISIFVTVAIFLGVLCFRKQYVKSFPVNVQIQPVSRGITQTVILPELTSVGPTAMASGLMAVHPVGQGVKFEVIRPNKVETIIKAPTNKSVSGAALVTAPVAPVFVGNPVYESNPLFRLFDQIKMGVSTDGYFVEAVGRINAQLLHRTSDKVFIRYEGGNAVPGLRYIQPKKEVEMKFTIYFGNEVWQELALPGAEIHLILRSSSCDQSKVTVKEAQYIYFDCSGTKHEYPKKVY